MNNHYTQIENDILETLLQMGLTVTALSCALFLIRKLDGYHKDEDMISNSQIAEGINKSIRSVINGMQELRRVNVASLISKGDGRGNCNKWRFNKDTSTWRERVKETSLVQKRVRKGAKEGEKRVNVASHTKENIQKKYTKENTTIKKRRVTLHSLLANKKQYTIKLKELYPTKDAEKAMANFLEQNEIKDYKYKDYWLALCKWTREDRFGEYTLSKDDILFQKEYDEAKKYEQSLKRN